MSQVWNYTDFRMNNIKDMIRQRKRKLENVELKARSQSDGILLPLKQQNQQIEVELGQIE
jgi:hypothetical protein